MVLLSRFLDGLRNLFVRPWSRMCRELRETTEEDRLDKALPVLEEQGDATKLLKAENRIISDERKREAQLIGELVDPRDLHISFLEQTHTCSIIGGV